ncbi:putative prostaglandin-E synthase [Helianthus annuus]|uniref:Prostaglandin E synthase 2 n=1 Tax=Helianthus annuus TaxID=4232 RepID=A0A251SP81_HELAN|nr:prostaglandin E synthase 2 [Helianthus annuus]KAF5770459.1 putative prostaglandin-E synthase [Helianthus annuus]KAJ0470154.1 putative prostaglandin-E synthase [Helianthus annuus]KAJ0486952.1 putative prostaglandin-E synthase [Helianthus annuus]
MRRASILTYSSALSRALLSPTKQHNSLFQATSAYVAGSSRRCFSTFRFPRGYSGATRFSLSLGGLAAATVAVGCSSLLVEDEAYAKAHVKADLVPKDVVLYQYEACPFCNKVKAFLDYYDVPYKVVEVNPFSKKEIKWSEYKKVPILTVDGEPLVDSSAIIDQMGNKIISSKASLVVSNGDEENKWRRWVDDHLVHMLSPNIYRNTSEALESFDYIANNGNFSTYEKYSVKYAGAAAMYFVSKKLKKKYNITDERAALYDAAETWVDALDGRDFLGGSKPNLADLAVFGVLRPIRQLKSGKDMVEHTRIGEWYSRMESAVGESSRIKA